MLRRRNFALLWSGDTLSELGSQATTVTMPLLVLALTGSPAKAGLTGFARALAYPVTTLPAGVLADRVDRRRLLIACGLGRAAVLGSIPLALALGRPPFAQLLLVAFVNAGLWSTAMIAERGLLTQIVPPHALPDAVALNEAREAIGVVGGPPIGGALFGVARGLPFLADAVSFLVAAGAAFAVRIDADAMDPAGAAPVTTHAPLLRAIRDGIGWLWAQPFLRSGSLLYAAANVTLGAVELLAVLVSKRHGASSAAVGVAFAIAGVGGIASALLAAPLRRRLAGRVAVLAEPWFAVAFIPALLLCRSAVAVGVVVALSFLPVSLSSSVVVGQRLALTPDHLRGRVQASASFVAGSVAWLGPLVVGYVFQHAGETAAVLSLTGWTAVVAVAASVSPGLRTAPAAAQTSPD